MMKPVPFAGFRDGDCEVNEKRKVKNVFLKPLKKVCQSLKLLQRPTPAFILCNIKKLPRFKRDSLFLFLKKIIYSASISSSSFSFSLEAINASYSSFEPTIILSYWRWPVPAGIKCPTITFSFKPLR